MKLRRSTVSAWIALLGILFSQMVLSAYACPRLLPSDVPSRMESHADMPGMPCAGMDVEQPVLCEQYGQQGDQSVGSAPAFDFQPILGLLFVGPALHRTAALRLFDMQSVPLARAASPPPLSRSSRLRI
jgi:hypothetical protein